MRDLRAPGLGCASAALNEVGGERVRPGQEGTRWPPELDSVLLGFPEPQSCPCSSQMVVWLPRSALPRAVTRYGLPSG